MDIAERQHLTQQRLSTKDLFGNYRTARSEAEIRLHPPRRLAGNPTTEPSHRIRPFFCLGARPKESAFSLILEEAENIPLARVMVNQTIEQVDAFELLSTKGGSA